MEREIGSTEYELPHKFRPKARGHKDGYCDTCGKSMNDTLHHADRVTETAADTGPALITEKGS